MFIKQLEKKVVGKNWSMLEIEKYPCKDRNEAQVRERYWIETLNANLNKQVPTRTKRNIMKIIKNK